MTRLRLHRSLAIALFGSLLFTLGGCASAASLAGREFLSTGATDGGQPKLFVAGTRIRLGFDAANLSASAGCNSMGGAYRIDGGRLVVDAMSMTEMACDPDREAQDNWLIELLGARPTAVLTGDALVLDGGGKTLRLLDRKVADPDRPLVGTRWVLESIVSGDAVSSLPEGVTATLEFKADGTLDVDTGCNTGSARWRAVGGGVVVTDLGLTKKACEAPRGNLENAIVGVLRQENLSASIQADRLSLRAGAGGLEYRAGS